MDLNRAVGSNRSEIRTLFAIVRGTRNATGRAGLDCLKRSFQRVVSAAAVNFMGYKVNRERGASFITRGLRQLMNRAEHLEFIELVGRPQPPQPFGGRFDSRGSGGGAGGNFARSESSRRSFTAHGGGQPPPSLTSVAVRSAFERLPVDVAVDISELFAIRFDALLDTSLILGASGGMGGSPVRNAMPRPRWLASAIPRRRGLAGVGACAGGAVHQLVVDVVELVELCVARVVRPLGHLAPRVAVETGSHLSLDVDELGLVEKVNIGRDRWFLRSKDGLRGEGGRRPLRLSYQGQARHVVRVRPEWSSTVTGRFRELPDDQWSLRER